MTRCRILGQKLLSRSPLRLRWLAIALVWVGLAIRNAGLFQHAVFQTLYAGYRWTWR